MLKKRLCRGCGLDFGEVPNHVKIDVGRFLDVCPKCSVKEERISERLTHKGIPSLSITEVREMRVTVLESLKRMVDELPLQKKPDDKDRVWPRVLGIKRPE